MNFNVKFSTLGRIKTQNRQSEFFEDYDFELKSNYDFNADKLTYNLNINSEFKIISIDENNDLVESFDFIGLSSKEHTAFEISIRAEDLIVPISEAAGKNYWNK